MNFNLGNLFFLILGRFLILLDYNVIQGERAIFFLIEESLTREQMKYRYGDDKIHPDVCGNLLNLITNNQL